MPVYSKQKLYSTHVSRKMGRDGRGENDVGRRANQVMDSHMSCKEGVAEERTRSLGLSPTLLNRHQAIVNITF